MNEVQRNELYRLRSFKWPTQADWVHLNVLISYLANWYAHVFMQYNVTTGQLHVRTQHCAIKIVSHRQNSIFHQQSQVSLYFCLCNAVFSEFTEDVCSIFAVYVQKMKHQISGCCTKTLKMTFKAFPLCNYRDLSDDLCTNIWLIYDIVRSKIDGAVNYVIPPETNESFIFYCIMNCFQESKKHQNHQYNYSDV